MVWCKICSNGYERLVLCNASSDTRSCVILDAIFIHWANRVPNYKWREVIRSPQGFSILLLSSRRDHIGWENNSSVINSDVINIVLLLTELLFLALNYTLCSFKTHLKLKTTSHYSQSFQTKRSPQKKMSPKTPKNFEKCKKAKIIPQDTFY